MAEDRTQDRDAMMTPAGILNRTNLASIYFHDGSGDHIRIYYQDENGFIREACYDQGIGWILGEHDTIGFGCLNTGIAATTWDGGFRSRQIRLYYFDEKHYLVERCWGVYAGVWNDGDACKFKFLATPVSSVTAICSNTSVGPELQVLFQGADGFLWQAHYLPESTIPYHWTHGRIDVLAVPPGSSIAAMFLMDGKERCVFTTNSRNQIIALVSSDGNDWAVGQTIASGTNHQIGAGLACASWADSGKDRIEVLSVTADNKLVGHSYDDSWSPQPFVIAKTISFSAIACFALGNSNRINVYFQPRGKHITEYVSEPNGAGFVLNRAVVPVEQ